MFQIQLTPSPAFTVKAEKNTDKHQSLKMVYAVYPTFNYPKTLSNELIRIYSKFNEVESVYTEYFDDYVNVDIVLKDSYSNDILEKLISQQLEIHDLFELLPINFNYPTMSTYVPAQDANSIY